MAALTPIRCSARYWLPLLLAAVALIGAACGGGDSAVPATVAPDAATDSIEEETQASPQAGQPPEAPADEDQGSAGPDDAAEPAGQGNAGQSDQAPVDQAEQEAGQEQTAPGAEAASEAEADPPEPDDPEPPPPLGDPAPYDNDNALRVLETLTVEIGERVQGSQGERDAAAFLAAEFESSGYEVELQPVPLESRRVAELRLTIEGTAIDAAVFDGSAGGAVGGPLVVVPGLGEAADFGQVDASGAIVLIQRGVLFFRDKIANAEAAGAAGVIIYNNQPGPFSGTLGARAGVPAVAISREDGLDLRARAITEDASAEVLIRFDELSGQSQNVIARNPDGACRVWVGGHYDSVPGVTGANDNGSGTALVVELARAYAGSAAGRQVCFVGFGAEEAVADSPGILGSRVFVERLVDSGEIAAVSAMLNLDVAAVGDELILVGDTALVGQSSAVAEALGIAAGPGTLPTGSGSDHLNFAQVGVPVIFPTLLGGPIHDPTDNFAAVQPQRLAAVGELAHGIVGCLAADADPELAAIPACTAPLSN